MTNWIIPCNIQKYDLIGAFKKNSKLNWKQSINVNVNDIVYIYLGKPIQKLRYKCVVLTINLPKEEIDDAEFRIDDDAYNNYGKYMELQLLEEFEDERLSYENLKKYGLNTVQGPSKISLNLLDYLSIIIKEINESKTKRSIEYSTSTNEILPSNEEKQYLWINFNSREKTLKEMDSLVGITYEYSWGIKDRATVRRIRATSALKPGDQAILVDIEPDSGIFARGIVTSEPHPRKNLSRDSHSEEDYVFDLKITEVFKKVPRDIILDLPSFKGVNIKSFLKGVSITDMSKEQFNEILEYLTEDNMTFPKEKETIDLAQPFEITSLYFEDKIHIERQVRTALVQGKNIIFTGPPGTGKSKLAKEVADFYQAEFKMVTASSNWSTYETLGGYHPNKENELQFKPGLFLSCVKDTVTNDNINQWLIIDELNRADIDKAFGSFFSVVTGDTISLPFEADNNQLIRLQPETSEQSKAPQEHVYVYPEHWRLIATMNTADKSSLFELSYAFMRRFAFINIGVPKNITTELVKHYLTTWVITDYAFSSELAQIWSLINTCRKMGPAIIKDIATYTAAEPNFTDALLLYVMPQLEGMLREDINRFIDTLKQEMREHIDANILNEFVDDFYGDAL
ncbi:MAG: AAA family ATPase [Alkalibacterium sp.]|nr:AAA family ATPase [Alkalibacterium sp.]